jgi:hypothetical protein
MCLGNCKKKTLFLQITRKFDFKAGANALDSKNRNIKGTV